MQPIRLDVGDECVELLALDQGEDVGERVELIRRRLRAGIGFAI
jgi:hypothetical protein